MYQHIVRPGETLFSISEDYRTPFQAILQANGLPDPNFIYIGQAVTIPGIPDPNMIPYSIIVSISQRTLTLLENGVQVKVYPIAVGRMLFDTPTGEFIIVNREPNPGGPFGALWLSLSKKGYGIHGTNNPASIGQAVSRGCIRMFNENVLELGSVVPNGTRVSIRP
ncbi:L,D-transpeptidase family protein [Alteribacter keqinensis]|uniref:LysM peptidoglycan-binding domain-containing protein n=1 Tax=Alteribacter keqinensis TaxID=2483800 RepID=A0A3M7TWX5_9BACI|nr:L,D-transpeptidase family protein [Alteribacter keqinensis]RNA69284.1 LysM peptidoglycan-binding domain-containing protein [Alteribacter keqinensis]